MAPLRSLGVGNRWRGTGPGRGTPRWVTVLVVVVGVCLVAVGFYLAIRLSMDVGYGDSGT